MSVKKPSPPTPPAENPAPAAKPLPEVIAFTMLKRDGQWHAIALKIQGRAVLDELIVDSSAYQSGAMDVLELATKDAFLFNVDVFEEEGR